MTTEISSAIGNGSGSLDEELNDRRRSEIVAAACEVIDELGYANTRIADVSKRVGIGQGTVYRYFTGKDDLIVRVIEHAAQRILGEMREDAAVTDDGVRSPEQFTEQITTVARRLLDLAVTEPHLMRVMLNQAPAVAPAAVDALTDQLSAATAAYLTLGVEAGYLRHDLDAAVVADAMTGVALPAIKRVLRGQLDATGREQTAVAIGRLIVTGASAAEPSST